jgi:SseB protein N-terminal domain
MRFKRRRAEFDWLDTRLRIATEGIGVHEGRHRLDADLEVGVRSGVDSDGRAFLPAFTSEHELLTWMPDGSHWVELPGRAVLQILLSGNWDHVVVDPAGPSPRGLAREDARRLIDGPASG